MQMNRTPDEIDLSRCLMLIETGLGWGKSASWSNYDFEKLSVLINDRTSVRLSVTTLKRIWGRLKYENTPTLTTLNALAKYLGYDDWRSFKQNEESVKDVPRVASETQPLQPVTNTIAKRRYWFLFTLSFLMLAYLFISTKRNRRLSKVEVDKSQFEFRASKMVSEGLPNSVVFQYDATAAITDSIFIVQTWDITKKKRVPKNKHDHSSIYYYPGFFRTKLIVDGNIVKTHDLWITSGGWLCLVENEPVPLYLKKEECQKNGTVEIDESTLRNYNLSLYPTAPRIRFYNHRDMGNLMSDNFTFETTLKTNFTSGTGACQPIEVLIQCKNDVIIIPLAAKACIGDMNLYFCGADISSKEADLSAFGCDLTEWTTLRVETKNRNAVLFVNGKKAYSLRFPNQPTGIVGVQFRFNGVGAVKNTSFENNGVFTRF